MFMVVLRHSQDDIPYRLCQTRAEAEAVLTTATEEKAYEYGDRLRLACSTPVCWWIYEFDANGELVGGDNIREAEDIPPPRRLPNPRRPERS